MEDPIDIMIDIIKRAWPNHEIDYDSFDKARKICNDINNNINIAVGNVADGESPKLNQIGSS